MDENTRKKLYAALSAPFAEACIQRTEGRLTGRGYDTTGIAYQYIVNRLNEVLGVGGFRVHREVTVKPIQRNNGKPAFEAICDLTLELGEWANGTFFAFAESLADGGHVSSSEADARKGAYTNAFKKAAAFHGVGRQAYEGSLDDDNLPAEGSPPPAAAQVQHVTAITQAAGPQATGFVRTGPVVDTRAAPAERNRLSSKQLAAIWSMARKLGLEQAGFRAKVKGQYGCQLEFLSRTQASELITALNTKLNGSPTSESAGELAS